MLMTTGSTSLTTTASIQLTSSYIPCRSVLIQNDPDNASDILVGNATTQLFQLAPGDSIEWPASQVADVYAKNVTSTTQTINWAAAA